MEVVAFKQMLSKKQNLVTKSKKYNEIHKKKMRRVVTITFIYIHIFFFTFLLLLD